jgi:hypothetical protein
MLEFANFGRSMTTIFRILLGDFSWDSMNRIGRMQANVWFWTFMWLVNLTMLNMLLAIIMDVYTEVKGSIGSNAETLWSQTQEIFHRWRAIKTGREVSLSSTLEVLDPTHLDEQDAEAGAFRDEDLFNVETLAEKIPGMKREQAEGILMAALDLQDLDSRDSQSLTDTTLRIQNIDRRMKQTQLTLDHLCHMLEMEASLVLTASEGNRVAARTQAGDGSKYTSAFNKLEAIFQEHLDMLLKKHGEHCHHVETNITALASRATALVFDEEQVEAPLRHAGANWPGARQAKPIAPTPDPGE